MSETRWNAWVRYRTPEGQEETQGEMYTQETRPDATRVILDLVPRGSETLEIHITKI